MPSSRQMRSICLMEHFRFNKESMADAVQQTNAKHLPAGTLQI
jgi:hypothetical protein